ncbi:MAG: exodeoxyribonuclease VII large subunit [Myxococcota bacterium]
MSSAKAEHDRPLRVSELNRDVRLHLEDRYGSIWVEGEIGDCSRSGSGHVYFTLNDETEAAQLRVVMFRGDASKTRAKLERGARIQVRGPLTLFEARGTYQLQARTALPSGDGELRRTLRALAKKLKTEGLFDDKRKRPLPLLPRRVGVVTSREGAALRDVLRVGRARASLTWLISPCQVQGAQAVRSILEALERLAQLGDLDVVLLTRGGGSLEDLAAFNDEYVARAVAAFPAPVITGVGHETDTTMVDLVADARAATPSNAAERITPEMDTLQMQLRSGARNLERAMEHRIEGARVKIERAQYALSDPRRRIERSRRSVAELRSRLARCAQGSVAEKKEVFGRLEIRLRQHAPRSKLLEDRKRMQIFESRLRATIPVQLVHWARRMAESAQRLQSIRIVLAHRRSRLTELTARLDAMSPLKVLARGYAIALHEDTGRAILSSRQVDQGDGMQIRLASGTLNTRVETIHHE